jgi:hypothetical protein
VDAKGIESAQKVSASRKLGREDAASLLKDASLLLVAKGSKTLEFDVGKNVSGAAVDAMLGPTGNLRAPTLRVRNTILVGYNDEMYERVLG